MNEADALPTFGGRLVGGRLGRGGPRTSQRRALAVALGANVALLAAEVLGGLLFGSLALLSDAAHMLSDVGCLSIALVAHRMAESPPTPRHSFGLQRLEVLSAQANGVALLAMAGWILLEAWDRLHSPADVQGAGLLGVAAVALAGNLGIAWLLRRSQGRSLNMRAAFLHKATDVGGSAAALLAGLAVAGWGASWADPAASAAIATLLVWVAWQLLRDTTHVLMEGAPRQTDPIEVHRALASSEGVADVHHVHLWSLTSDVPALSAHVVLERDISMEEADLRRAELRSMLLERFGIDHATLEIERMVDGSPDVVKA